MTSPGDNNAGLGVPIVGYQNGKQVELAIVDPKDVIAHRIEHLPTQAELNRQIAGVVSMAIQDILTGKIKFKSAGEAARVTRDLVGVAKDLNLLNAEAAASKATTPEERTAMLQKIREEADNLLGLPSGAD